MNKEQFDNLKKGQRVAIIATVEQKNSEHQTIRTNLPGTPGWIPKERLQHIGLESLHEASEYMDEWDGYDLREAINVCRYLSSLYKLSEKSYIPLTLGLWNLIQHNGTVVGDSPLELESFCALFEDDIHRLLNYLLK